MWQEIEYVATIGGNIQWLSHYGKQDGRFFFLLKNRNTLQSSNSASRYMHKRIESKDPNTYLHVDIHCNIVYNTEKSETTQVYINR